jgi:integrase
MTIASLTKDELLSLLRVAKGHSEHDWLLILVTYSHGLRASEAINLTKSDCRDGYLTVKRLKGSMKTTQPFVSSSDPLLSETPALESRLVGLRPKDRLFPITRRRFAYLMQRYGKAAGIPQHKCHPHSLKHTCGIVAIKHVGVEYVRQYLGHKSLNSTGAYLRVSDAQASEAVAKAFAAI